MELCWCLSLLLRASRSLLELPPDWNVSVDYFINDLNDIQQRNEYVSHLRGVHIRKSYLLKDLLNIQSSGRYVNQSIKISNLSITAAISIHFKRVTSSHYIHWRQITLTTSTFSVSILYSQNTEPSAVVEWIRANKQWTGTQTMHIVHHILPRLGVWDASLRNKARFAYEYRDHYGKRMNAIIALIELRCIRGKTTDWYAEFGYFNHENASIARRMRDIHNYPVHDKKGNLRGVTLGPYLHDLWNKSDKTEFHNKYKIVEDQFECLLDLRDEGKWTRTFI